MTQPNCLVMKFGGAALADIERFSQVASLIQSKLKNYEKVVVVVSAMAQQTDGLLKLAKEISQDPPKRELDMLVSVGERISMSLLAMALDELRIKAKSFTGSQSGIITCKNHSDAQIIDVRPYRIAEALKESAVVIVAGFQGMSLEKEITTLGRGGSDTTAVALGVALQASVVEFYKDVKGIYSEDPKKNPKAKFYKMLTYDEAFDVIEKSEAKVLHPRAVKLAKKYQVPLSIKSFDKINANIGTTVLAVKDQTKLICQQGCSEDLLSRNY